MPMNINSAIQPGRPILEPYALKDQNSSLCAVCNPLLLALDFKS